MNKKHDGMGVGGECLSCGDRRIALLQQIEVLKRRLLDRDLTIVQLEAHMAQEAPHIFPQGQVAAIRIQCDHWQDKYERLLEAHKKLQKVNQGLEDKLLRLVDRTESEKSKLTNDTANLTTALTTAAQAINRLKQENERYKNDLSVAIQLLQCNPSKYAPHKLDNLPSDLQRKARARLSKDPKDSGKPEMKVIKVPIPTFPPTAMVYSVNKYTDENEKEEASDAVSAAIMAAVLEERAREHAKLHCTTCTCNSHSQNTHTPDTISDDCEDLCGDQCENCGTFELEYSDCGMRRPFKLQVIDVGTQTLPSYIGETEKVQATCIYCQSSKLAVSEKCNNSGSSVDDHGREVTERTTLVSHPATTTSPATSRSSKMQSLSTGYNGSAWDWPTESLDSGSPSTPSSLISASLSYESETSNTNSPQDSPEKSVMHSTAGTSQSSSNHNNSENVRANGPSHLISPYQKMLSNIGQVSSASTSVGSGPTHQSPKLGYNSAFSTTPKIPFNARSPYQDVFTPTIHRSPPGGKSFKASACTASTVAVTSSVARSTVLTASIATPSGVIAASTKTSSATETTL
ncbi:uncharacterized protein LOC143039240 isoform X2 [Oratosquilla oratoria]|uniref:uncharacterized protein LOC143039240 isoform X2 n=1 Tax=Oratosquilla oratoria TaxID=337810 RepID=UPI003F763C47